MQANEVSESMAAINSTTLNAMKRTLFYRLNQKKQEDKEPVPVPLPFDLVTIDEDFQAYEPVLLSRIDAKGNRQVGTAAAAVYLPRAQALPRPPAKGDVRQYAVWSYYGI